MKSKLKLLSLFLFFILSLCTSSSFSQERKYSIHTLAGKLSVSSEDGELECTIKLSAKVISTFECDYSPKLLKHFKQDVAPFDEVFVFQNAMLGNACDGLDIFFIGINRNKKYQVSESVPYCGGPPPMVVARAEKSLLRCRDAGLIVEVGGFDKRYGFMKIAIYGKLSKAKNFRNLKSYLFNIRSFIKKI
jgi:hypothetical protein